MFLAKTYETDSGFLLTYSVGLFIGYNGRNSSQDIVSDPLFPASLLLPEIQWFPRSCATKQVAARSVVLTLESGDLLHICYPFRPGTAKWFAFWEHLKTPEVLSVYGVGEKCSDKILRNLLGIS